MTSKPGWPMHDNPKPYAKPGPEILKPGIRTLRWECGCPPEDQWPVLALSPWQQEQICAEITCWSKNASHIKWPAQTHRLMLLDTHGRVKQIFYGYFHDHVCRTSRTSTPDRTMVQTILRTLQALSRLLEASPGRFVLCGLHILEQQLHSHSVMRIHTVTQPVLETVRSLCTTRSLLCMFASVMCSWSCSFCTSAVW